MLDFGFRTFDQLEREYPVERADLIEKIWAYLSQIEFSD